MILGGLTTDKYYIFNGRGRAPMIIMGKVRLFCQKLQHRINSIEEYLAYVYQVF